MTPELDKSVAQEVMEVLMKEGTEGISKVMQKLLNETMKHERDQFLNAKPYERTGGRRGYANGFKPKKIKTRVGAIKVEIPQVRGLSFYPKSLTKGCRSERALKLAIAEMYVNGVSTRRVTEITEKLCGLEISSTQVSQLCKVLDEEVSNFKNRALGQVPYIILDARYEKIRHENYVRDFAVLIAIGVNSKGKREVLGFSVSLSEAEVHWRSFLQSLTERGLHGVEYAVSDDHKGLKTALKAVFPKVHWQRCQFHFAQNAQSYSPKVSMRKDIAQSVRDIFACPDIDLARTKTGEIVKKYEDSAPAFSKWLELSIEDCFAVYHLPPSYRQRLRTVNSLENLNREIRRRTLIASIFPNRASCSRLVGAILVEIHEDWINDNNFYLNMADKKEFDSIKFKFYRKKVA
jgi:transposase-like protein